MVTIKCKHCGEEIELTEALSHEVEEKIKKEQGKKVEAEIKKIKEESVRIAAENAKVEYEAKMERLQTDLNEDKERSRKLIKQLEDMNDEMRQLRRKDEERNLEMKRRLAEEEDKIRQQTLREAMEEHDLKDKEKDKKLSDLEKALEDARRKAQQGSQQTQGEVLELEIENLLKKEFPEDIISEVKKGQRGADVVQTVVDKKSHSCGEILWETKNAVWSKSWIAKLKEDQRERKSDLAVLVSIDLPKDVKTFSYDNGVWVCSKNAITALALALRYYLIRVNYEKLSNEGKNEKSEFLFNYITSTEFKHRIESIAEAFGNLQIEMEREKRWFHTKWARQEKELRKVLDNTHGMYGDLQGVVGKSLPEINTLKLDEGE